MTTVISSVRRLPKYLYTLISRQTSFYFFVAQEIAEKYPMLRLSVLLEAEKKFVEGDVNGDGVKDI